VAARGGAQAWKAVQGLTAQRHARGRAAATLTRARWGTCATTTPPAKVAIPAPRQLRGDKGAGEQVMLPFTLGHEAPAQIAPGGRIRRQERPYKCSDGTQGWKVRPFLKPQ